MWWPFQWLFIYILGGMTFVPLLIVTIIAYVWKYGSTPIGDADPYKLRKAFLEEEAERDELVEKSNKAGTGDTSKTVSGWLTVRRQFSPTNSGGGIPFVSASSEALAEDTKEEREADPATLDKEKSDSDSINSGTTSTTAASNSNTNGSAPTTYSARIAQTYRSMVPRATKKDATPKEYFFCVLKGSVLFLYDDESASNCVAAIGLDDYLVRVEGEKGKRFKGRDGEMFAKRNAIVLRADAQDGKKKRLNVLTKGMPAEDAEHGKETENKPIFLFSKSNTKMEDWYIALVQASMQAPTTSEVFTPSDMQSLVDTIDTEPDPIPMRWFNAFLGRVFFALYKTEAFEQFIIGKIMKKLVRVPRPGFLGPIVVREVNVGTSPPFFSKPMLKDLTADGTAAFEVNMQYRSRPMQPDSEIRITIATTATIPTGFKPYVVDLVLAVVLKSLEGNLVVHIKNPPSNRVWYAFTQMPKMDLEILPVVSERKIQIGMILKTIEKQLKDVIADSIVLPNMDDLAFFDTSRLDVRGGIFSEATKVKRNVKGEEVESTQPKESAVEIETSHEDPSSATPATASNIRKRHAVKSKSIDLLTTGTSEPADLGISRTETAPPGTSLGGTAKKAAAIQATKKWFAHTGATQPPSLSSQTVKGGLPNTSTDSLERARSRSSDRHGSITVDSLIPESNFSNTPEVTAVQVSSSTAGLAEGGAGDHPVASDQQDVLPPGKDSQLSDVDARSGRPAETKSIATPTTTNTSASPGQAAPPMGASVSSASLISSLRSRDKKALQAQMGTAKEQMKKWGVNFAAKRRAGSMNHEHSEEREEYRPAALYRPPEADPRDDAPLPTTTASHHSPGSGMSLQERLNAAAHAAATAPISVPSRDRSSSSASRLSLLNSPSKAAITPASASPPGWTLSSAKATTGVVKDEASAAPSASSTIGTADQSRRPSSSSHHTVFTQPAGGRSMVVPRVPKRPGQVTGIGSNLGEGMVRKVSTEDGLQEERVEDVKGTPPSLPSRHSVDGRGVTADANPGDIPTPEGSRTPADTSLHPTPPRIPPRKATPSSSRKSSFGAASSDAVNTPAGDKSAITKSETIEVISPPTAPQLQRSDTAPIATDADGEGTKDSSSLHPSPPRVSKAEFSSPAQPSSSSSPNGNSSESPTKSVSGNDSPRPPSMSGAESALRKLAQKNEDAIKARKADTKSERATTVDESVLVPRTGSDEAEEDDSKKEQPDFVAQTESGTYDDSAAEREGAGELQQFGDTQEEEEMERALDRKGKGEIMLG
ncbi:hypothetical protein CI109_102833 [Kwoniella shandongensis]|uniref:Uncharacterized protein n=1 Tax=Kwoniella shandongensis TaxID=1734106 RepID=A0A5M6C7S6_9TREE|nr:uncharacterized protein CI109_000024 [Kwoniella shandongensis]KAA5531186.1 hypothetical protein CI109_000024 [Kwoniella shandongensis]